ncbi:DnaJ domain-containing protein [Cadophora sp. MPI-SDFR-AT-0126]|nr:DnaJ domain-containing protein [Leotiomycetes sp. MPI-SDFR-AT-0126]
MSHQIFVDHYKVLGIARDASTDDIQKGYKKMSLKHHPDKNNNSRTSTKAFQRINEAKSVLSNPEQRHIYNQDYDQHIAWTLRGGKCKRKSGKSAKDDSDEELQRAAANLKNKRARDYYEEQERPASKKHDTGKPRCHRKENNYDRGYGRPRRPGLWAPYQHPDIRVVGDMGWCY